MTKRSEKVERNERREKKKRRQSLSRRKKYSTTRPRRVGLLVRITNNTDPSQASGAVGPSVGRVFLRHKSELYVESHWQGSLMIDLVSDVIDEGTRNESLRKGVPDGIKAILRLGRKRMKPVN